MRLNFQFIRMETPWNKTIVYVFSVSVILLPITLWQLDVPNSLKSFITNLKIQEINETNPISIDSTTTHIKQQNVNTTKTCNWRNGNLVERPCSSEHFPTFEKKNILMVGDSVTRFIYFGVVRVLCGQTGCANLPSGALAPLRCDSHSIVQPKVGFKVKYINQHYGTSPMELLSKSKEAVDIVYWQSGLWLLHIKNNKTVEIEKEYSKIISEARFLCKSNSVKKFYVVDTMPNLKGTVGNLDYGRLNKVLSQQWQAANISKQELGCLHLLRYEQCVIHDWRHIRKTDKVHPTLGAAASLVPWLWAELGMGSHALPCRDTPIYDERPAATDYWCVREPTVVLNNHNGVKVSR